MRDGKINIGEDGGIMLARGEEENTIINNIWLSLAIRKGEWWLEPDFGLDLPRKAKNLSLTPELVKAKAQEALKWIQDLGRARSIEVEAKRASGERIDMKIVAVQADGRDVTFETFAEVI